MDVLTQPRLLQALSGNAAQTAQQWLRRLSCELAFARSFASLFPEQQAAWLALIDQAGAIIDGFSGESLDGLVAAVEAAETVLQPIGAAAKGYTIHCVGHGHIDMNWMWSWPETTAATHDTFASVLQLMREFPTLTYSQSQASVYALMEKYHPEMFAEIQQRVKEGRWEVTAVHWVEGDKNLASGESLARHLLYTRRYTQEKFGLSAADLPLDWEPDTFGHANTIPTILAQGGVKFYYGCRLGGGFDHAVTGDFPRPRLFWWQGPDGSRVLVNKESTWYNSYVNIGDNIALPAVEFFRETQLTEWLNVYGIGNHGGGPTRAEVTYLLETGTWPIYPKVCFGTAKGWFERVVASGLDHLPVLDHELNFEFTGCYTTQTLIKQANRLGENYCVEAETLAALTGRDSRALLRDAWLPVLFNQFHDILPGSGVRQTREHATALFQETGAITGAIKREAGKALAAGIDTAALVAGIEGAGAAEGWFESGAGIGAMESGYSKAGGGGHRAKPYVIYNPCAWERSEPMTVRLYDTGFEPSRIVARDEHGQNHPTLLLSRGSDWGHSYFDILFLAQNIPALGYRTFAFCEGAATVDVPQVKALPRDLLETPFLNLTALRYGSGFEVQDKRVGEGTHTMGTWHFLRERPRGMTAWVLGGTPDAPVPLTPTGFHIYGVARNQGTHYPSGSSLAYVVQQHLRVPGTSSTVRLSALVHGLAPRIDVQAEVDWRELGSPEHGIPGLSAEFAMEMDCTNQVVRYETPFGSVVRDGFDLEEVPSLRYAHLGNRTYGGTPCGFTLLNDAKYGHMRAHTALRLRVTRSSYDPDHAPEICRQTFRYGMVFHNSAVDASDLTRMGAAFNHPLVAFPAQVQAGSGALSDSFVAVETPSVVLTALKQAESGAGLVLRLVEYDGQATQAVVRLHPSLLAGKSEALLCDLLENPTGGRATIDGNRLIVPVRGLAPTTIWVR